MSWLDLPIQLESKILPEPNSGCWLWMASFRVRGYGSIRYKRKMYLAHRLIYELKCGAVPDGLVLDHKCRIRCCVNPDHLEPVTSGENSRRGDVGKHLRDRTHCPQGHAYDAENTRPVIKNGISIGRYCAECKRIKVRDRRARLRNAN